MEKGTVKFFKNGYGFIERDGSKDIFFHFSDIIPENEKDFKSLDKGDVVEFEVTRVEKNGEMKDAAINVKKIS
jgi:cold shock CspA family protein